MGADPATSSTSIHLAIPVVAGWYWLFTIICHYWPQTWTPNNQIWITNVHYSPHALITTCESPMTIIKLTIHHHWRYHQPPCYQPASTTTINHHLELPPLWTITINHHSPTMVISISSHGCNHYQSWLEHVRTINIHQPVNINHALMELMQHSPYKYLPSITN